MTTERTSQNGSYLAGTIGALLGGLICAMPWGLVQAYLDKVSAILACLIGFGAFKTYQMFRGKSGRPTRWIIISVTILSVFAGQWIAICVMLLRNNAAIIEVNIQYLLTHSTLVTIIFNLILGLIMALLGTLPASSYFKDETQKANAA